jgi:hypothetical protein
VKESYKLKFASAPDIAHLAAIEVAWKKRRNALMKRRESKLVKYLPTIRLCIARGHSPQDIANVLLDCHHQKIGRTAVWRFIKANPLLTEFATVNTEQNQITKI